MTILDNILAGIIAFLAIALGALLVVNADLRADLAHADANAATLARANADFKSAAVKQNAAIAELRMESEAKTRAAVAAVKAASRHAKLAVAHAKALAHQPDGKDDCAAATKILRDYLKGR